MRYQVQGQLFFATMSGFVDSFDAKNDPDGVVLDFSRTHVWDQSAVIGISKVFAKYEQLGKRVYIEGLNEESKMLVDKVRLSTAAEH